MAKAKNPRLQAQIPEELKKITDGMIKHLNMSQTQFFEKYLPMLFMAIDKEKYLELVQEVYDNNNLSDIINSSE